MTTRELTTDILVVGAGLGGVAAALAAADRGANVILTEEFPWIGGQLTSQAVPPDEHPWVEEFGVTARSTARCATASGTYTGVGILSPTPPEPGRLSPRVPAGSRSLP